MWERARERPARAPQAPADALDNDKMKAVKERSQNFSGIRNFGPSREKIEMNSGPVLKVKRNRGKKGKGRKRWSVDRDMTICGRVGDQDESANGGDTIKEKSTQRYYSPPVSSSVGPAGTLRRRISTERCRKPERRCAVTMEVL